MSVKAGTFFRSRWVERPPGVEELDPVAQVLNRGAALTVGSPPVGLEHEHRTTSYASAELPARSHKQPGVRSVGQ